jgi:tRNA(Ile)-lysidine synthase
VRNASAASIDDAFSCALEDVQARIVVPVASDQISEQSVSFAPHYSAEYGKFMSLAAIAIAYSGGLDSSVLLRVAGNYAAKHGIALYAFHIHHGISPNADAWLAHCRYECTGSGIIFDARHIDVAKKNKSGTEEAARNRRYAALGELCRVHQVPLLLTAHHQDDQAETVLLQLLRGTGVAGLSGMDAANVAPDLLGDADLVMARPLLALSREALTCYAASEGIAYIDDESNADTRYARNALRHKVMPSLAACFPGFQQRFARTAQHAQSAQRLLIELAVQDLAQCQDGDCIDVNQLRMLSEDRGYNMLRYWFGSRGVRMPSTSWLSEMRAQLLEARPDAQLCVTHADCHIRRHRDRIFITRKLDDAGLSRPPQVFQWNGAATMAFPHFGGVMHFEAAERGVDVEWLRTQNLSLRLRAGGEKLKLALNRPTKSLKYHYQDFDVPAWERERLPIIDTAGGKLLFAAGVGMDCHYFSDGPGLCINFRWQSAQ